MFSTSGAIKASSLLTKDAPTPPFVWSVAFPPLWRFIDLNPDQTAASVANLFRDDSFIPGVRLEKSEERELQEEFLALADGARSSGVAIALLWPAIHEEELCIDAIFLRWVNSSPQPADLLGTQRQISDRETSSIETTKTGDRYLLASNKIESGPITDRYVRYSHEAFIPVPSTTWTLIVSATTPTQNRSEVVRNTVKRIAFNFEASPAQAGGPNVRDLPSQPGAPDPTSPSADNVDGLHSPE